jgi:hypothetical protein
MKRTAALALGLALMGFVGFHSTVDVSGQTSGFTTLFDGSTLKGWNTVGDANWELADGAVQATRGSGFLVTPASYGDFQITLDFWVTTPTAASSSAARIPRRSRQPTLMK